jgi:predicted nucleotidyltransferase
MGPTDVVFLGVPPVRIDILQTADGIETEPSLARSELVDLGALKVRVLALDDLIANKRAAGRLPKSASKPRAQRAHGP